MKSIRSEIPRLDVITREGSRIYGYAAIQSTKSKSYLYYLNKKIEKNIFHEKLGPR